MINLALVGKEISHSKSPDVYRSLLGEKLQYYLLDYKESSEIPALKNIFLKLELSGLSITAPYKTHFVPEVKIEDQLVKNLGVINCVKKENDTFLGTNTDLLACHKILKRILAEKKRDIVILGDGSMTKILDSCLKDLGFQYSLFSRRKDGDIEKINLNTFSQVLVVNACSRNFFFQGELNKDALFWDLNYNLEHHQKYWGQKVEYVDGMELLELQAQFALDFWSLS